VELAVPAAGIVILAGWAVFWIYRIAASIGVKAGRTRWARGSLHGHATYVVAFTR
jgi:hypothetical protein